MPIQKGSPKYSKQYKTTLFGETRKQVELYIAQEGVKESEGVRDLIIAGLMAKAYRRSPDFKFTNQRPQ